MPNNENELQSLNKVINWYPGHMAKARRLLAEQLSRVDCVIELCDARLPHSSRNPDLDKLVAGKSRILLLNKADLASPAATKQWLAHFRAQGLTAYSYQATDSKARSAVPLIQKAAQPAIDKAAERGIKKTVRAMVIGVTNVGKSSFINRLYGANIAKTGDRPGVTRSNQWVKLGPYLEIMDSPGLLWPRLDDQTAARRLAYIGSIKDDILDVQKLAISLLDDMMTVRPDKTCERFHVKDASLRGDALLEAVCRGRGFLMKGGVYDTDRCCSVVLDEFRAGKLGALTLEFPPEPEPEIEAQDNGED